VKDCASRKGATWLNSSGVKRENRAPLWLELVLEPLLSQLVLE
jgi:hypothetical protein